MLRPQELRSTGLTRGRQGLLAPLALLALLGGCASSRSAPRAVSPQLARSAAADGGTCFRISTDLGAIDLRFDPAAAPIAIAEIRRLAETPPGGASAGSRFDGLELGYARPRLELRLQAPPGAPAAIEAELDATVLGLDRELVTDPGMAMNALQNELLPALRRPSSERRSTPTLEAWSRRFEVDHDPSFLVGKSRKELLEAIGYRYRTGVASRPATRGAVALVPVSPHEASLSLALLLSDLPSRTGRWVIVGEVVAGLELAEAISLRPLAVPEARNFLPLQPVVVRQGQILDPCPFASANPLQEPLTGEAR
jgi:hypothetical protein